MQRRKFLKFAALGAGGGIAAGGAFVYFENFDALARKIILNDTAMLKIEKKVYDAFFNDVEKQRKWDRVFQNQHQQLIKWHYYVDNPLFRLPYATSYEVNRSKLIATFLLSTDFFINKMDASKPISYRGLFDQYNGPCSNPFSDLYYPNI